MQKLTLGFASCLLLAGCATPKFNYLPNIQNISKPPIGVISTANLGDNMLTQGKIVQRDAVYIDNSVDLGGYDLTSGYFAKRGEDEKYEHYITKIANDGGTIAQSFLYDPPNSLLVRKSDQSLCIMTIYNIVSSCKKVDFERKNWSSISRDSFQQNLIYNGKVGQKINIGYREFSSDIARPAFSNNVEYDLSESSQIGYKGALIEVLDANNQEIKYTVIKNFN